MCGRIPPRLLLYLAGEHSHRTIQPPDRASRSDSIRSVAERGLGHCTIGPFHEPSSDDERETKQDADDAPKAARALFLTGVFHEHVSGYHRVHDGLPQFRQDMPCPLECAGTLAFTLQVLQTVA